MTDLWFPSFIKPYNHLRCIFFHSKCLNYQTNLLLTCILVWVLSLYLSISSNNLRVNWEYEKFTWKIIKIYHQQQRTDLPTFEEILKISIQEHTVFIIALLISQTWCTFFENDLTASWPKAFLSCRHCQDYGQVLLPTSSTNGSSFATPTRTLHLIVFLGYVPSKD